MTTVCDRFHFIGIRVTLSINLSEVSEVEVKYFNMSNCLKRP